jgi:hypothetical protein
MERALIHEAGHTMLAFPDLCLNGSCPENEEYTVMNSEDPRVGEVGSTHFNYHKCDEAGGQLARDVAFTGEEYADCFVEVPHAGATGLRTEISVAHSSYSACNGYGVLVEGRLQVSDNYSSYNDLGGNPLTGRTVWFDRDSTTHFASTTPDNSPSGNNWSRTFSGSNATYTYTAYFSHASGDGLSSSPAVGFSIHWGPSC